MLHDVGFQGATVSRDCRNPSPSSLPVYNDTSIEVIYYVTVEIGDSRPNTGYKVHVVLSHRMWLIPCIQ